jgi:hypothetical protein
MPQVGLEHTMPLFKLQETADIHILAATVMGPNTHKHTKFQQCSNSAIKTLSRTHNRRRYLYEIIWKSGTSDCKNVMDRQMYVGWNERRPNNILEHEMLRWIWRWIYMLFI